MRPPPLLLLTRPEAASRAVLTALAEAGAGPVEAIVSPLIGVVPTGPLPDPAGRTLIFTSANGVQAYRALNGPAGLRALCVGAATARAAAGAGLRARAVGGDADALVAALTADPPAGPLLHLHGSHTRGAVAARLRDAGLPAQAAAIYDQPALPPSQAARAALSDARPVVAPLFSPRTAALLCDVPHVAPLLVAAMSEAVANAASPLHSRRMAIAAAPNQAEMVALTAALLAEARVLEAG